MPPSIFDWVRSEETKFLTDEIKLGENWYWNMYKHIQIIFHLSNGVFFTGENNWTRAFKSVMEEIVELSTWTEDIEVKDVVFFIEEENGKVLSFLVKKYHDEVYVREHDLDTLFDEITESDLTYGGAILQKGNDMPERLELNSIAFCDQTNVLGGVIGFKHYFSPDKLRETAKYGWGKESNGATITLEDLCVLATAEKTPIGSAGNKNQTTGKNIEAYIVRGNLPSHYLNDDDDMEDHFNQIQVIAFYVDKDSKKQGVTLYRKKEVEGNLKFFTSKEVYQRGLGRGLGERLLGPQIWTNFLEIHKMNMLEAASKVPLYTDDPAYTTKNKIQDMDNLEITTIEDNKRIYQVPTAAPANIQMFANEINSWFAQAQAAGSAYDPIMGKEAASGTTFRGQERSVAQAKGIHDKRRGQRAKFIEELYRDWILPDIKKQILKGNKFLATLSTEELTWVADQMSITLSNRRIKDMLLEGKAVPKEEQDAMIQMFKSGILKKGNKHLVEILKDEFKDVELKMGIDVAGKQKDLVGLSDKLLSLYQDIFAKEMAAPGSFQRVMQIPAMAKTFENILEYGGLSIGDFSSLLLAPPVQPMVSPIQPTTPALKPANQ
jgi:hypothetical protein